MDSSAGQPMIVAPEHALAAGLGRLLIVAALVEGLWLPWPQHAALITQRYWALAFLAVLTLLVLAAFPIEGRSTGGALAEQARLVLAISLGLGALPIVALTGGWTSPLDFLYVLPALCISPAMGAGGLALVTLLVFLCSLTGGAAAPHSALGPLGLGRVVERAGIMALLSGAVLLLRISRAERRSNHERVQSLASAWKNEVLAIERARGELLAHVSHEFVTPISAIRAGAGVLASAASASEVVGDSSARVVYQRLALNIQRNAVRLALLVEDLIELARLEERRPALRLAWHSCSVLLRQAVEAVAPLCEGRHQTVRWEVADSGLLVWGDARRIEQVLINLAGNAYKYAGEGAVITLSAFAERDGVRLEISDTGPGLSADAISHLFDRYYRCPGSPGQGSGLGLAIAQAQVELHRGAIWAENNPGAGCRFISWFPHPAPDAIALSDLDLDQAGEGLS